MVKKKKYRTEKDSLGSIRVPESAYYGAQTARSLIHFPIGHDTMPDELIRAFGVLKKAAALANYQLQKLPKREKDLIVQVADEIIEGKLSHHFPLRVWQTGSGTQTNMNVNEVISNRAIHIAGGVLGSKDPIHPNDHVNLSQSSNDTFPTAMHLCAAMQIHHHLLPSLEKFKKVLQQKQKSFSSILKIGRTHLQDAVPLTLGQEFSGYASLIERDIERIKLSLEGLYDLALGGSAVGTGLNTDPRFANLSAKIIADLTSLPFRSHPNKFAALSSHDEIVFASGALKTCACSLKKIATDIAFLGSGPRCGLQELILPENEPGSSIMPGKVNPTQCEALCMVAAQVIGADAAITFAGTQGNFELNVYKPVMIFNLLHAIHLMRDSVDLFCKFCIEGIKPNKKQMKKYVEHSLMLATALNPILGYDKASKISLLAHKEGISLKEACLKLKFLSAKEFDRVIDPKKMV